MTSADITTHQEPSPQGHNTEGRSRIKRYPYQYDAERAQVNTKDDNFKPFSYKPNALIQI